MVDVDDEFAGAVINGLTSRGGSFVKQGSSGTGKTRLLFHIATRSLIGYYSDFLSETRGTGVLTKSFLEYAEAKSQTNKRANGALISMSDGIAVAYALWNLEPRGVLFIEPQEKVYVGMIVGLHNKDNDLEVNPTKNKQLSNMRTTSKDEAIRLQPIKKLTIEECISFLNDDELLEVTPKTIRLRKRYLDSNERKRMSRSS
jgi:GTP-binding protein